MNIILDILGSVIIGAMLLLMLISFQYKMRESADRYLYMKDMIDHTDKAAEKLNKVIALAGVGFTPAATVSYATTDSLVFNTYWNYETNSLQLDPLTISIKLNTFPSPVGKALVISQNGIPLNDFGYIFWVDDLDFKYYDRLDALTTTAANVRSAELWLSFTRSAPVSGTATLKNRIQVKCFFMNAYMRGA
jgi:hypothetical protein